MKKIIASAFLSIALFTTVSCQMNKDILPESTKFSRTLLSNVPEILLPPFTDEEIANLDYNDAKNGRLPKFARNIVINVKPATSGIWTNLPDGSRIWRVQITSKGASGLFPLFDTLYIPEGALLHIYMPGKEEILGAFTHDNTLEPRGFCSGMIHGESCIIEYYEPLSQKGKGIISLDKIGHAYRWVKSLSKSIESSSGSCEINPACSEGSAWHDQLRSSVRITIIDSLGEGYCSGTLINNVRNDCTPYILSAQHCTEDGVSTTQYSQWIFLFNNHTSTCNDTSCPTTDVINGCKKIADSEDGGGNRGSDFLLLKLNSVPPSGYNVFYSGWNNTNTAPSNGVCLHHPRGDCTKISTYISPPTSASWGNIASDTHWELMWSPTANGYGISEPGSSGSALYNQQKLVVGHLTGGSSCCTLSACGPGSSPTNPDLFGKLSFDWNLDGVSGPLQLQPWLDPDNTGTSSLQGTNPPCGGSIQNDAGIQSISLPNGDICSQTFTPSITLRNFGDNTLTSAKINYTIDNGNINTQTWTGSIIPGGSLVINLPSITLDTGSHAFAASTSKPNNTTDNNTSNDFLNTNFYVSASAAALVLNLTTDDKGSETTWQINNSVNDIVAAGGPYANFYGGEQFRIPMCLEPGCYTFTIFDANNNGMTNGEVGNFQLAGPNGSPVYASLTNVSFGSQETHNFCIQAGASGIEGISTSYLSVVPNPSSGLFNVGFDNGEQKNIKIYDILGQLILEKEFRDKNVVINLSSYGKGVYILRTETPEGKNTQKLVVD